MGLKSIEVVPECYIHGRDINTIKFAGRMWCANCLRDHLNRCGVMEIKMVVVENMDDTDTIVCRHCGGDRHDDDRPCAICGGER